MPLPRGTRHATTFKKEAKQLPKKKIQPTTNNRITQVCAIPIQPIERNNQAGMYPASNSDPENAGSTNNNKNTSTANKLTSVRINENRT